MKLDDQDSYPFPEEQYVMTSVPEKLGMVRTGDFLRGKRVGENKTGTKWAEVRDDEGKLIERDLMTADRNVGRNIETQASKDANYHANQCRFLCRRLAQDHEFNMREALAAVTKQVDAYGFADYSPVDSFIAAQAKSKVMRRFKAVVEARQSQLEEGKWEGNILTVRDEFAESLTKHLCSAHNNRARSRGSNAVSNLLEDCDREAMAWWLDEFEYFWR